MYIDRYEIFAKQTEAFSRHLKVAHVANIDEDIEGLIVGLENMLAVSENMMIATRKCLDELYSHLPDEPYIPFSEGDPAVTERIRIEKLDGLEFVAIKLTLPLLMPNRRNNSQLNHFRDSIGNSIYRVISKFILTSKVEMMNQAAVIFVSIHKSKRRITDNDNKELSSVLNALNYGIIRDDMCISLHMYDYYGDVDRTEVFVTSAEHYLSLLKKIQERYGDNNE